MGIIRLVLAVSVVMAHTTPIANNTLVGGPGAVRLFYIISGFYMALVLNEKYRGTKSAYGLFVLARLTRLLPLYYVVLLISLGLTFSWNEAFLQAGAAPGWTSVDLGRMQPVSWLVLIATNLLLMGQDAAMFLGYNPQSGALHFTSNFNADPMPAVRFLLVPQAWSLGSEMLFYLLAPFVVVRKSRVVALILFALGVRWLLHLCHLTTDPWSYRFFPAEVLLFAMGALAYYPYKRLTQRGDVRPTQSFVIAFGIVFGFGLFGFVPLRIQELLQPALFVIFALLIPRVFLGTKNSELDRHIGELSYPIYLVHSVVVGALFHMNGHPTGKIAVPITVASAVLLWWFVDVPAERLRKRMIDRLLQSPPRSREPAAAA